MKKKSKQKNKYDSFIESLIEEFIKIPNFNLTFEDELGRNIFNFSVRRVSEIATFKSLFKLYLIASSRAVVEDLKEINNSKYKNVLILSREDLSENYYETIRLGFIGLFHKYENYIAELIEKAELLIDDNDKEQSLPLTKYSEKEFEFKIKDFKFSPFIERLNWICNCNKHYDGYPKKTPKPTLFEILPENQKMKLSEDNLIQAIDSMIKFYPLIMQLVFTITMHKMVFENDDIDQYAQSSPELFEQLIDKKNKVTEQVKTMIESFKRL